MTSGCIGISLPLSWPGCVCAAKPLAWPLAMYISVGSGIFFPLREGCVTCFEAHFVGLESSLGFVSFLRGHVLLSLCHCNIDRFCLITASF